MARAIKQSVDGSGYPSSSTLFPITREEEEEEEGRADGKTLSMRRGSERTIYIFGSVVVT